MKVWIVLVLVLAASRIAAAQPASDADDDEDARDATADAKAADHTAREHYRNHEYKAAIRDYQHAHDALPDPLFLFDMAQSYRHLHECERSRDLYREYLQARPDADDRPRVERFIEQMDACTPKAEAPVGPAALLASNSMMYAGIATAGLGLALIGTGVYFSINASDDAGRLEAACAHGCSGASVAAIDHSGQDASHNAALTYTFGGAVVAAGAAMFVWATLHGSGEPPAVTPTTGGATVSARFHF